MGLHDERTQEHASALMLTVVTWLWGKKYGTEDVRKLQAGVTRHLKQDHRFFVAHPQADDDYLTKIPGCFCRLRMFDKGWQAENGVQEGDRIACMDLDSVVTGELDPLFNRPETFMILQGANAANPCPFNGSLMMLRAGWHQEVWSDFTLEKAQAVPFYEFPDDQGWLHHKLPNAAGWKVGSQSGVYAFMKPGWPTVQVEDIGDGRKGKQTDDLPVDARLVVFPGWRSPEKFKHLPWIKQNWAA